MSPEGLILSGAVDLNSSHGDQFVPKANQNEKYYSPETLVNNTTEEHNEIDYLRIQDGKRKEPDYIIVFREDGKISNMEEAKKAQEQWGGLPIVIVDKDKCLKAEKQKVYNMMERYNNGEKHLAGEIWQKVRNNRVTRSDFCAEIDLEQLKEKAEAQKNNKRKSKPKKKEQVNDTNKSVITKEQVDIQDLKENYERTTPRERKQGVSRIRSIHHQIQQIVNEKEGEEVEG